MPRAGEGVVISLLREVIRTEKGHLAGCELFQE